MDLAIAATTVAAFFTPPLAYFFTLPAAFVTAIALVFYRRKRKLMRKLSELLGATLAPAWVSFFRGEGYGSMRGSIEGRTFKIWAPLGGHIGSTCIRISCSAPAIAAALSGRAIYGNVDLPRLFPAEAIDALRGALSGDEFALTETARIFARGATSFDDEGLLWESFGFRVQEPETFASMIPLLACISTCLERSDVQRKFIGMNRL